MSEPIKPVERKAILALVSLDLSDGEACECFLAAMSLRSPDAKVRLNITYPKKAGLAPSASGKSARARSAGVGRKS